MSGKGRSLVLGVASPDRVLSFAASIAMAAVAPSCLVIDLIGDLHLGNTRTLADILEEGPRLAELSPGRKGVALIGKGPIGLPKAEEAASVLGASWPALIVRADPGEWNGPTVPVTPIYPGLLAPTNVGSSVWQPFAPLGRAPGPGPVMPSLRPGLVRRLLVGQIPRRSRWMAAWEEVWGLPWA